MFAKSALFKGAAVSVLVLLLVIGSVLITGCADAERNQLGERSVEVFASVDRDGNPEITVRATLHRDYVSAAKGESIYLFALTPGAALDADAEPIAEAKAAQRMTFNLCDIRDSAVYAGYVIADLGDDGNYHMLTQPVYLSNAQVLGEAAAAAKTSYPEAESIKGLWISEDDDAVRLSPSHTVIEVSIADFLCFEGGPATVEYLFDGVTNYLQRDAIDALDRRIKLYSDAGIQVYLNIVLDDFPSDSMPNGLRSLYAGEAQPGVEGYAIRVADYQGFTQIAGFLSFLAERYTRADEAYGFAGAMIIGEAVNQNRSDYYAGARDISVHAAEYLTVLRIADTAMRTHFADGRVYAAVGNNFTAMSATVGAAADPLLDYSARDFLDLLAAHSRLGGDFPWHVAMSMPASDASALRLWEEKESVLEADAYITPRCLQVLTDYLEGLTDDYARRTIISAFSIPSGSGSEDDLLDQSASYAYAYAKALETGNIDALIYRAQTDDVLDTFGCGLRSAENEIRPIYHSFASIDQISANVPEWERMGDCWDELSLLVAEHAHLTRTEGTAVKAGSKTDACEQVPLFDFSCGNYQGFSVAENAEYLALVPDTAQKRPVLRVALNRTHSEACMGVRSGAIFAEQFERAEYVAVNCLAETAGTRAYIWLRLTQRNGGALIYEGEASVIPNEWTELYFDIGDYADALHAGEVDMQIWLQGDVSDPADGKYALLLDSVDLLIGPSYAWVGWLIGVICAVGLLVVAFLCIRRYRRRLEDQRKVHLR